MLQFLTDFFLWQWLWAITWGIYYVPINLVIMFVLCKWYLRIESLGLLGILLLAQLFAGIVFTMLAGIVITITMNLQYIPSESAYNQSYNLLWVCVWQGLIYACAQIIFFALMSRRFAIDFKKMALIACASNAISAFILFLLYALKY